MKRIFRRSDVRPDAGRDVGDEIQFHLEMRTREFIEFRYDAFHQSPDSGTSVWSPKTCGDATGRSAYQS